MIDHEIRLRARYADTDTMQVVHYANYFVWFESGRIELLRSAGLVYKEWERMGLRIPVVEAQASYKSPARFDDEVAVRTWVSKVGNTSIRFDNEVFRLPERELICTGHTVHVLTGPDGKPVGVPPDIRARISP